MCFKIDVQNFPDPKIAEEDIPVIKVYFNGRMTGQAYRSVIQHHGTNPGDICIEERFPGKDDTYNRRDDEVDYGFHSFDPAVPESMIMFYYDIVVKCIIPKGSLYLYNKNTYEFVSKELVIGNIVPKGELEFESKP